jgi:hypothetical protein
MRILLTIIGTVLIFSAGVFAGVWMQRTQPVPPPPTEVMGEIRDMPIGAKNPSVGPDSHHNFDPARNAELRAEIEKIQPEIDAFKKKLDPIKTQCRHNLEAVLTPEQRERLASFRERLASQSPPNTPGGEVHNHAWHPHEGLESLFPIVLVENTLDRLTEDLTLTPDQRTKVRALLMERRSQFLELVDHSPPPSLRLSRLSPLANPAPAKPSEAK